MVAAYLIVNLLVSIPVLLCIARAQSPLAVDPTGMRFAGQQAGWEICTFTGWVTPLRSRADVRGGAYGDGARGDDGAGGNRARGNRARGNGEAMPLSSMAVLRLTDGTVELSMVVDEFDVFLHPGQMATVCEAVCGRRSEYIAVINDSTGEQFYNQRGLWRIASPSAERLLLVILAGMVFWLLLASVVILAVVTRLRVRRFQYTGVGPLLRRANAEASALRRPWAA